MDNYETAEGVSLPRSTLYNHYMRHCNEHKLDAVNAASFGKLIRSVFTGLRTRRLGTRGNSKYHYYGIRVKPGSTLASNNDEKPQTSNSPQAQASIATHQATANNVGRPRKSTSKTESYEACSQVCMPFFFAIIVLKNYFFPYSFLAMVTELFHISQQLTLWMICQMTLLMRM